MSNLTNRIISGLETVKRWESELEDKVLLAQIRSLIPLNVLCPEDFYLIQRRASLRKAPITDVSEASLEGTNLLASDNPYAAVDDDLYEGDDLLLKRLALFFQKSFMKWVNNPPCQICGSTETQCQGTRGPSTQEEHDGNASRVELYFCPTCDGLTTTFPRYNNPRTLLQTRKGRCGEFANLFGFVCRAVGFETRYILDFTDHVWVEVWSNRQSRWIMADSCEGKIDAASMYEKGWSKKLSYIVAFTTDSVTDVTKRYTRVFNSTEFLDRRKLICPSEFESALIIAQFNATLRKEGKLMRSLEELERRATLEKEFLESTTRYSWDVDSYNEGRISGSLSWRVARGEVGSKVDMANVTTAPNGVARASTSLLNRNGIIASTKAIEVETFSPNYSDTFQIIVRSRTTHAPRCFPECITVSGVACGGGIQGTISIVVIDQDNACVLLSRVFSSWSEALSFLLFIPDERVFALVSDCTVHESEESFVETHLSKISGLSINRCSVDRQTLLCIGQINSAPDWAVCELVGPGRSLGVSVKTFKGSPIGELALISDKDIVPHFVAGRLPDSIMPLHEQLKADNMAKKCAFLSFKSKQESGSSKQEYIGFTSKKGVPIYLMKNSSLPLKSCTNYDSEWETHYFAPKAVARTGDEAASTFQIPVNESFFSTLSGPTLLWKEQVLPTATVLSDKRLIAFYFSAHWCPPCRQFTPMLSEFYSHINDFMPTALEIVFVSSDRDSSSFGLYYGQMPWLAIPYDDVRSLQHSLSARFAITGIPALVVLDALSGDVVVTAERARVQVTNACRLGSQAIEKLVQDWIMTTPAESQMIIDALHLSSLEICEDAEKKRCQNYLFRENAPDLMRHQSPPCRACIEHNAFDSFDQEELVLSPELVIKYVDNARRDPSCPKYRSIRLSNKVFDRITSSDQGIDFIMRCGFQVHVTDADYVASIPLAANLEEMLQAISKQK